VIGNAAADQNPSDSRTPAVSPLSFDDVGKRVFDDHKSSGSKLARISDAARSQICHRLGENGTHRDWIVPIAEALFYLSPSGIKR
jgi:hypothetical protein